MPAFLLSRAAYAGVFVAAALLQNSPSVAQDNKQAVNRVEKGPMEMTPSRHPTPTMRALALLDNNANLYGCLVGLAYPSINSVGQSYALGEGPDAPSMICNWDFKKKSLYTSDKNSYELNVAFGANLTSESSVANGDSVAIGLNIIRAANDDDISKGFAYRLTGSVYWRAASGDVLFYERDIYTLDFKGLSDATPQWSRLDYALFNCALDGTQPCANRKPQSLSELKAADWLIYNRTTALIKNGFGLVLPLLTARAQREEQIAADQKPVVATEAKPVIKDLKAEAKDTKKADAPKGKRPTQRTTVAPIKIAP